MLSEAIDVVTEEGMCLRPAVNTWTWPIQNFSMVHAYVRSYKVCKKGVSVSFTDRGFGQLTGLPNVGSQSVSERFCSGLLMSFCLVLLFLFFPQSTFTVG